MLRQKLRAPASPSDDDDDDDAYDGPPRRPTFVRPDLSKHKQARPNRDLGRMDSIIAALSEPNSELARFLLKNTPNDEVGEEGSGRRKCAATSMGTNRAWYYSLALEPMEVRRERIIMLAEAYAIFGALFLNGTWFLYEFGGVGSGNEVVDRMFGLSMALAIISNVFMAMFSSFLWLMSVLFSGSHHNWVWGARKLMALIHVLLVCVLLFTVLGVGLGLYSNLSGKYPELAISLSFFTAVVVSGMYYTGLLVGNELPLEYYHFPFWFKLAVLPFPMLTNRGRKQLRAGAKLRAEELKERAFRERTVLEPDSKRLATSDLGILLRQAADSLGRDDYDISQYEERLEADWYNSPEQLKRMNVEILGRYMPRRLAEEVHSKLQEEFEDINVPARASGGGSTPQTAWPTQPHD